jgi:hypothetical protein
VLIGAPAAAQNPPDANYDEAKVGTFKLPDPLVGADGKPVASTSAWRRQRRGEILELFRSHVYGRSPARPRKLRFVMGAVDRKALGGKATRKEITIHFSEQADGPHMDLLLYVPNDAKKPVPAFLGLNFKGNHSVSTEPGITLSKAWMRPGDGVVGNHATEATRGAEASRWQVETVVGRGYALATAYYGDIEPDHPEGWKTGVRSLFAKSPRPSDDWGAIGAWAWGLSRALDYLETDHDVDAKHVAVLGHSRLGKTALWAGVQDDRFAIVISNDSGEGGAALARRNFGETVKRITASFPHWFAPAYSKYADDPSKLPVDQHELIALVAPRPVYVASALDDKWADPHGEFLSAKNAEPVYKLFGLEGLGADDMPPVDHPIGKTIGYHIRTGKHDVTAYDWAQYLDFADRHLRRGSKRGS